MSLNGSTRLLIVLLSLAGLTVPASACNRVVAVRRAVVVKKVVAVQAVTIAQFVPVVVAVPQYSVSLGSYSANYAPQQAQGAYQAQAQGQTASPAIKALQDENVALRKEIEALRKAIKGASAVESVPEAGPHVAVLSRKCAACHDAAVADTKAKIKPTAKAFVMFQGGKLRDFSEDDLGRISRKLFLRRMPPANNKDGITPLSDEENDIMLRWLDPTSKGASQ